LTVAKKSFMKQATELFLFWPSNWYSSIFYDEFNFEKFSRFFVSDGQVASFQPWVCCLKFNSHVRFCRAIWLCVFYGLL